VILGALLLWSAGVSPAGRAASRRLPAKTSTFAANQTAGEAGRSFAAERPLYRPLKRAPKIGTLANPRLKPGATDLAPASPAIALRVGADPTTDNRSPITRSEVVY
jgi:hypothetical protein